MEPWFRVPGQGCPVALAQIPCNSTLDCTRAAAQYPSCSSLLPYQTSGLAWTSGGISSSVAGSLRCDPFRRVCGMQEKYEETLPNWGEGVLE